MSLRETLLQPISGPNRVGEYLRHQPIYDQIKEARREDLDLPQGEWQQTLKKADWPLVIRLTSETLSNRSKDLQIAVWLTEALLRRDGFGGLRNGLDLVAGLIDDYWDDVFPPLDEDDDAGLRVVPLEQLGQSLELAVRSVPLNAVGHSLLDHVQAARIPSEAEAEQDSSKRDTRKKAIEAEKLTPEEFAAAVETTPKTWYKELVEDLDGAQLALAALERIADERFGGDAPNLIKLRTSLQEVRQTAGQLLARKLVAEPDPAEVEIEEVVLVDAGEIVSADGDESIIAVAASVAAPRAAAATPRTPDEASSRVAVAARFLRAQSPTDPAPYLMLRGYRWGELRRRPGEVDPRLLEAPPTELRSQLKTLLLDERWPEVLEAGEEVMAAPYGRGWLDLQRYAVTACDALGQDYDALGAALRSALRALLQDLPQLPARTLLDDSPTANPETLRWLQTEVLNEPIAARPEAAEEITAGGPASRGRDPFRRALDLAARGQTQRAIELLVQEANQEQSERGRFLRRTQAATVMVEAGLEGVALPILQEIVGQIETHQLERWEDGQTVGLPLDLFYRCIARHNPDDSSLEELYLRICRLDPIRAIQLQAEAQNGDSGN